MPNRVTYHQPVASSTPVKVEREDLHTWQAAILVPLGQAVITGLLIGIAIGVIAWAFKAPLPGKWFAVSFALSSLITWVVLVVDWRATVWSLEKALHTNLDGDPYIGRPPRIGNEAALTKEAEAELFGGKG